MSNSDIQESLISDSATIAPLIHEDLLAEDISGTKVLKRKRDDSDNEDESKKVIKCNNDHKEKEIASPEKEIPSTETGGHVKVDQSTNTEEEYVVDLEKILKNFNEDYKNLEADEHKQMLQKFYTQNLRLATRCQKLKAIVEKGQTTITRILREASKQVNPHQLAFISAQLINNGKLASKRVWSPQMKNIMVGLLKVSPAAFRFLSKALVLPTEEEINQWINQGTECDLLDESVENEEASSENISMIEAQAVLDEIAFENLMATLL